MHYFCCDERRRAALRATGSGNGIDFLEVVDGPDVPPGDRQRMLRLHFVNPPDAALLAIAPDQVRIEGGARVRGIRVVPPLDWQGEVLAVRVDRPGDFSVYTLRLGDSAEAPLEGLDPLLSAVEFSFKVECPSDFDCSEPVRCPPEPADDPEIDYLARDYHSFRQLMLDRMAVTTPEWRERNPADVGIALVEVLAYAADHVSYQMDSTGMEASLATARLRTSVRRHARLVDYRIHDGSNARTWVHVEVAEDAGMVTLPEQTQLLTRVPGIPRIVTSSSPEHTAALNARPVVFETMEARTLHGALNRFDIYAWGDRECCLPRGATSASLRGRHEQLRSGDVLVFVEQRGPRSGAEEDADPAHRHAVRLSAEPAFTTDPLGSWFGDSSAPLVPVDVTEITWAVEDALPFALCVSAIDEDGVHHDDVSRALGNIVLADHGRSRGEDLPVVPVADPRLAFPAEGAPCEAGRPEARPARYAPVLAELDLTMAGTIGRPLPGGNPRRPARFDPSAPASSAFAWQDRHVLPEAHLIEGGTGRRWDPRRDLLASSAFSPEFVAECEAGGLARLRFGDGEHGMLPRPDSTLAARYRTGSGAAGNIGADALWHVVTHLGGLAAVRNPLPARGGTDPDPRAPARPRRLPGAAAGGHPPRLRRGRAPSPGGAAGGLLRALDRHLVHDVPHARPQGWPARRRGVPGRDHRPPRALPHGGARRRGRRPPIRRPGDRARGVRPAGLLPL
jgi:hypothetical protein